MSAQIREAFDKNMTIKVTPDLLTKIDRYVSAYEVRDRHALALNSYMLGVEPFHFLHTDRDGFLELFNVSFDNVNNIANTFIGDRKICGITSSNLRHVLKDVNSINTDYKVASDPFNIFIVYAVHLILLCKAPEPKKLLAAKRCIMFLEYKFFTSLVNHRFPYKPNPEIMTAMYESLSGRFDLRNYGTWKGVMEARADDMLQKNSIHYKTFLNMDDDKNVLYVVTDLQSRIRNQINIITAEYMRAKDMNDVVSSYSNTGSNLEGEKVVIDDVSMFDMMVSNTYISALSVTKWLDEPTIRLVSGLFSAINPSAFRSLLINFSELAVKHAKGNLSKKIEYDENGNELYVGCEVLIGAVIQKSFRFCINNGVDMKNTLAIVKALRNVYTASRVQDDGIMAIRNSTELIVTQITNTTREVTLSAFRIGLMLYIAITALKYTKT